MNAIWSYIDARMMQTLVVVFVPPPSSVAAFSFRVLRSKSPFCKSKVKAYTRLGDDLYLRESRRQTARRDMSQSPPHAPRCKRKQRGREGGRVWGHTHTQRVAFFFLFKNKTKQIHPDLRAEVCFLEVLSELSLFLLFWH